jgi:hypothetical protein
MWFLRTVTDGLKFKDKIFTIPLNSTANKEKIKGDEIVQNSTKNPINV